MPELFSYLSASSKCAMRSAKQWESPTVRGELAASLDYLIDQPRSMWRREYAHKLRPEKDKFRDYFEVRFFADRVQQRPIGFFHPSDDEFIFLFWAIEKQRKLIPDSWSTTCESRRSDLSAGLSSFCRQFDYTKKDHEEPKT